MNNVKLPFYAQLALTLLAIVLIIFFLIQGRDIFVPLVFAVLVGVLLYPLNKFLENKLHLGRAVASFLSVFVFITVIAGFIYFFTIQIVNFSQDIPMLQKRVGEIITSIQHWISYKYHINTRQQTDYINKSATDIISRIYNSVSNIFLSVTGMLLLIVFVFIFSFFMLYHRRLLLRFILHLFRAKHRDRVNEVISETRSMMNSYVLGLVLEMIIVGIVNCTLLLILGIKYAVFLGVLTAVMNIIPYLGIYSSTVFAMLITFANSSWGNAFSVGLALIIVHILDSNVLMPRIVGGRVKMNPMITIIAVLVGEFIWGIPGMFLFIPIVGMLKIVFERVDGMQPWAILIGTDDNKPILETKKPEKARTGD
jgi:predicted PurR-regulated permease PerM